MVEDLISTGGHPWQWYPAGGRFSGPGDCGYFLHNLPGQVNFQEETPLYTLTDYDTLIEEALARDYIKEEDLAKLRKWRENPADEGWINS